MYLKRQESTEMRVESLQCSSSSWLKRKDGAGRQKTSLNKLRINWMDFEESCEGPGKKSLL
jgi:hypothetical protein